MAGAAETLVFKLMIDGKEAIATLDLTKGEFVETGAAATAAQEKIQAAYKNLSSEAMKYDAVTEANVKSLTDFMKTQSISIDMIENTITVLKNEIKTLDVNSDAWKQKIVASTNLKAAMGQLVTSHTALGNAQQQMMPGLTNMNQAIGQFGYILGDANMFMMSAQMGIMSIANNIPFVVQGFMQARQAAGEQASMMELLTKSIMGGGGIIIGINALMLLLQVLPAFFKDNSKAVEEHSKEIENLTNKYEKLTQAQLENKKAEIEKELLQKTLEYGSKYGDNQKLVEAFPIIGGMIEAITPGFRTKMTKEEAESYNKILAENQALTQVMAKHGVIKEYEAQRNLLLEKRKEIKDPDQIHYLDQVIKYYDELIKKSDYKDKNDEKSLNKLKQFAEAKGRVQEDLFKDELLTAAQSELNGKDYVQLLEMKEDAENKYREHLKTFSNAKSQTELDGFNFIRDVMEKNIELIDKKIDEEENLTEKEIEEGRKRAAARVKQAEDDWKFEEEKKKWNTESTYKYTSDPFEQREKEFSAEETLTIERAQLYGATEEQITNIKSYYANQRANIERQSTLAQLNIWSQTLATLGGMFAKHTAAYKLLAIAQATIDTYKNAVAALGTPPVGPWNIAYAAAITIAGLTNVAKIAAVNEKVPGYARGGAIVGENGMEIIAPAEDYASGMAELVTQTAFEVRNYFNGSSSGDNSNLINRLEAKLDSLEKTLIERPALAYLNNDEAIKVGQHYEYEQKTSR